MFATAFFNHWRSLKNLIDKVYGFDLSENPFYGAILCPTKSCVDIINMDILEKIPCKVIVYLSSDTYNLPTQDVINSLEKILFL